MLSRFTSISRSAGRRYLSKHLGRVITSQSAYLVSEETPLTKFFTRVPKLEEGEKHKLWINEEMEKMGSVDEGAAVLKKFCEHHYFVNEKALNTFILRGMTMDLRKVVNALCDPAITLRPNEYIANILIKKLQESGDGDSADRFSKRMEELRKNPVKEPEEYTPYEHLRSVVEKSDFYA
ncbi:hypothetical protein WA538_001663, partial [Blastocystis sp. DL]